jgi:hypothetical protein
MSVIVATQGARRRIIYGAAAKIAMELREIVAKVVIN